MVPRSATAANVQELLERAVLLEAALEAAAEPLLLQQLLPAVLKPDDAPRQTASAVVRVQRLECTSSSSHKFYEQIITRVSVVELNSGAVRSIYTLCSWYGSIGRKARCKPSWPARRGNLFTMLPGALAALDKVSAQKRQDGYFVASDTTMTTPMLLPMHVGVQDAASAALWSSEDAQAWLAANGLSQDLAAAGSHVNA
jgi:hypothetical protein